MGKDLGFHHHHIDAILESALQKHLESIKDARMVLKYLKLLIMMGKQTMFPQGNILKVNSLYLRYEPCPFEFGLRKFALDPVIVIFFQKMSKKLQVLV